MIRIGKIVATHGLQGGVILTHIIGHSDWLKKGAPLFVELNKESYIPYFTLQCKASNNAEYIVNLEDIEKVEQAKRLVGKHVYADTTDRANHRRNRPEEKEDRGKSAGWAA